MQTKMKTLLRSWALNIKLLTIYFSSLLRWLHTSQGHHPEQSQWKNASHYSGLPKTRFGKGLWRILLGEDSKSGGNYFIPGCTKPSRRSKFFFFLPLKQSIFSNSCYLLKATTDGLPNWKIYKFFQSSIICAAKPHMHICHASLWLLFCIREMEIKRDWKLVGVRQNQKILVQNIN